MSKPVDIGKSIPLALLLKEYAEEVVTTEGNMYYRLPYWFQQLPGNFEFVLHTDVPEDLVQFITKAGLGGDNPQIIKVKL